MKIFEVKNLSKTFRTGDGDSHSALSGVNFSVKEGEFLTFIGPNGSGKSTLLSIMGLLLPASNGKIFYKGRNISNLSKREKVEIRRKFSFVRQKPLVLDTSVYNNIAYGLEIRGIENSVIKRRVKQIINKVGLNGFEEKKARSLSGGEIQRVAIAMNFVIDPEIYFLDEVSANLDQKNVTLLENFINEIKEEGKTIIMSTHDRIEAIKFSDRIGVLNNGEISQIGKVNDVFTSPKDEFSAVFVGYENIFTGEAHYNKEQGITQIKVGDLILKASEPARGEVKVLIKPESIGLSKNLASETSYQNSILGTLVKTRELRDKYHIILKSGSIKFLTSITKISFKDLGLAIGSKIYLNFKATDIKLL